MGRGEAEGGSATEAPTPGGLALVARRSALIGVEWAYHVGSAVGSLAILACGGFVPVIGGWLRDEIVSWSDVIRVLGGVRVESSSTDPDADLGPVLGRSDAPALFDEVALVARRLGARSPQQIRLTYLPCCGVVAWGRSRALVLGLPLLDVLNRAELRAILAHEMAHLARGDATRSARSARFVHGLGLALDRPKDRSPRGPLRAWAVACRRVSDSLIKPIARGQETRADRAAASLAGGVSAASALVKAALVQPLFREVLEHYDPSDPDAANLYQFFRAFWARLPDSVQTTIRYHLLTRVGDALDGSAHPPLLDRISLVQSYPDRPPSASDLAPAAAMLADLEALEQMLHNRLFGSGGVEPSVFHKAGS